MCPDVGLNLPSPGLLKCIDKRRIVFVAIVSLKIEEKFPPGPIVTALSSPTPPRKMAADRFLYAQFS